MFGEDCRAEAQRRRASFDPPNRPWRIKTALAFTDHERAVAFESYLKSSSGGAFAKKRL